MYISKNGKISINQYYNEIKAYAKENTIGSLAYNYNKDVYESIVYIKEFDEYEPYLVLHNNYNKTGSTILLREKVVGKRYSGDTSYSYDLPMFVDESTDGYLYSQSTIDTFLNDEFLFRFDEKFLEILCDTKLEFFTKSQRIAKGEDMQSIYRKFFLPSYYEIMGENTYYEERANWKTVFRELETTFMEYLNKKAYAQHYNYDNTPYWTRSIVPNSVEAVIVSYSGHISIDKFYNENSIRPACTISSETEIKEIYDYKLGRSIYVLDI